MKGVEMRRERTTVGLVCYLYGAFDLNPTILFFKHLREWLIGGLAIEDLVIVRAVWVLEDPCTMLHQKLLGLSGGIERELIRDERQSQSHVPVSMSQGTSVRSKGR